MAHSQIPAGAYHPITPVAGAKLGSSKVSVTRVLQPGLFRTLKFPFLLYVCFPSPFVVHQSLTVS